MQEFVEFPQIPAPPYYRLVWPVWSEREKPRIVAHGGAAQGWGVDLVPSWSEQLKALTAQCSAHSEDLSVRVGWGLPRSLRLPTCLGTLRACDALGGVTRPPRRIPPTVMPCRHSACVLWCDWGLYGFSHVSVVS